MFFELNSKGNPTRPIKEQNNKFFVDARTKKKIPVDFQGLLAKDTYIADKQYYLMQIFRLENDVVKVRNIYYNWDWLEFIDYQQSYVSLRILDG